MIQCASMSVIPCGMVSMMLCTIVSMIQCTSMSVIPCGKVSMILCTIVSMIQCTIVSMLILIRPPHVCVQMPSLTLRYLRGGGVVCATTGMRNNNDHPICVRVADDNPLKQPWDNKPEILWKFSISYLAAEGLTETSEEARPILVYIQHGQYFFTRTVRKQQKVYVKPVIHALHFSLTAHRSRFVQGVSVHFKQLYSLLEKHPGWVQFLADEGKGVAPRAYLAAVEVGIRSYAFSGNAKLTMGIGITKKVTREMYANIAPWRKIECYITAARFKKGLTSYNRWENFLWSDFIERKLLWTTFVKRHLPISDGEDHFGGMLKDPPSWTTGNR